MPIFRGEAGISGLLSERAFSGASPPQNLAKPLRNDLFRADEFTPPEESPADPHNDPAIVLRIVGWLIADYAMNRSIDHLFRLDLFDVEAMQNLDQRMNGVFEVVAPLRNVPASILQR